MSSLVRRGLRAAAAAAIAFAIGASPGAPASAASAAPAGHAVAAHDPLLTIRTSGDRTSSANGTSPGNPTGGSVTGVAGVTYSVTDPGFSGTCGPTGANGECSVEVPSNGSYTITQTGVPTSSNIPENNYFINQDLGTGTAGGVITPTAYNPLTVDVKGNTTVPVGTTDLTPLTVRSGRWAVSRYNPPPPTTCTRSVALLFDLSASTTPAYLAAYKAAATEFVRSLESSSTDVTLYTFGTAAPAPSLSGGANDAFGPVSTLTAGGVATLVSRIDGLQMLPETGTMAQYTNWDAGLWQMTTLAAQPRPHPAYNEALVLTDGDPTAMGANGLPDASGTAITRFRSVENGIFSANALKAEHTRIIAVGLEARGHPVSVDNLKSISGPTRGGVTAPANMPADFYLIPFDDLKDLLTDVALADCASLSIVKTARPSTFTRVGQAITYTYRVTNTSPSDGFTLRDIAIHDNVVSGPFTCSPIPYGGRLAPGQYTDCTATYRITQADMNAGRVENSAYATGRTPNDHEVRSPPDDELITGSRDPAIEITKTASPTTFTGTGETIRYTYVIRNTGNVTLTNVHLTDNRIPGPFSCSPAEGSTLQPNQTMTCTRDYTTTAADVAAGEILNTGTAHGTPPPGLHEVTDTDDAEVNQVGEPDIEITKTPSPTTYTAAGQTITYHFVITNTGTVDLHNVTVTDNVLGPITNCDRTAPVTLAPGEVMTCTATHLTTQADVDAGSIHNTATATGTPPPGLEPPSDEASADVTAQRRAAIEITKTHTPDRPFTAAGETITYRYTVTNTGNVTLTNVHFTDSHIPASAITCRPPMGSTLRPSQVMTCTARYKVTVADLDAGYIKNYALATGTPPGDLTPPTDEAHDEVPGAGKPSITLTKTASPTTYDAAGQTITYRYLVTNNGALTLTGIGLTDTEFGTITCPDTTLAPSASMTCTHTHTTTQADVDAGSIKNSATVTGTGSNGETVMDTDDETVTAELAPSIHLTKTASPQAYTGPGQMITYTYVVTNTGNMTLRNITLVDDVFGPITCPDTTLAPLATMTCTHTHTTTVADVDAGEIFNTALATGHPDIGKPVTDEDEERVVGPEHRAAIKIVKTGSPQEYTRPGQVIHYSYLVTNVGNVTLHDVTVTDTRFGTVTCPHTVLAPGASMTCHATHTTTQADVDAGTIANIGTATGRPPRGPKVMDESPEEVTAGIAPSLEITKTAHPLVFTMHGQLITYTYTVTNTGNVTLHDVVLDDTRYGMISCPETTLAPGATMTCTHIHAISATDQDEGSIFNSAAATGRPPNGGPVQSKPAHAVVTGKVIVTPPPPIVPVTG